MINTNNSTKSDSPNHVGALNVECPKCGVKPGIFCVENPRSDMMLVHDERVEKVNSGEDSE
jgi:hypothetical protein